MKRLEWLSRELLIVGLIALGMLVGAKAVAAPPGAPQAQQLSVPDATRWFVYADRLTGRNYAAAIRGLREVGARQIVLHHWAWQTDSPLGDALPQFIADGKANGISFCLHIDANTFGPAPHDKALDTMLDRAVALGIVDGAYIDGCEAFRGAGLTTPEANHFAYAQRVKDKLGLTGKRCYVEASSWQYCYSQVWALGTIDQRPEDQASLSRQVAACSAKIASCADAAQPWSRYGRSFGWLGPAIDISRPMASYPPEEYAEAWTAARRANAWVHMQVTLEWLSRTDPDSVAIRQLIAREEAARASRPVWGVDSARTPSGVVSPPPAPPVVPPVVPPPQPPTSDGPWKVLGVETPPVWATQGITADAVVMDRAYGLHDAIGGAIRIRVGGTPDRPKVYDCRLATFTESVVIEADWVVVVGGRIEGVRAGPGLSVRASNVAIRDVEVTGGARQTTSAISIGGTEAKPVTNVVVMDCKVHHNGSPASTWPTLGDEDHHGIGVGAFTNHVWIVGNELYHNSGNGVQINAGTAARAGTLHSVFVLDNDVYANKQDGLWCKQATDVWFVGNRVWDTLPSRSSPMGSGIGAQYGPVRLRIIGNRISQCATGIYIASKNDGSQEGLLIEGNDIRGLVPVPPIPGVGADWQPGAGVLIADGAGVTVRGNTIDATPKVRVIRGTATVTE